MSIAVAPPVQDMFLNTNSETNRDIFTTQAAGFNAELLTAVKDSNQTVGAMYETLVAELQSWRSRWVSWCENDAATINKANEQFTHPGVVGFTTETLDASANLALSTDWVAKYGPVTAKVPPILETLDDVHRGLIAPQKKADAKNQLASTAALLFPLGSHRIVDGVFEVHDLAHADPLSLLRAEFSRSLHMIAQQEAQLAQVQEERESMLRNEDVKGVEERSQQALQIMKKIRELCYTRHENTLAAVEEVDQYHANVRDTLFDVRERVASCSRENAEIQKQTTADLQRVQEFHEAFSADAQQKAEAFRQRVATFRQQLNDNTKEQLTIWETVLRSLRSLQTLAHDRDELTQVHLQDTAEERRRAQHEREVHAAAQVKDEGLKNVLLNVTRALEYLQQVSDYTVKAEDHIERCQYSAKLKKMQCDEGMRSYELYRRLAVDGNRMLLKREQRLENVRRLLRGTEFQIANAVETLDTDLQLYRTQYASLQQTESQLSGVAAELQQDLAAELELWIPIEAFLDQEKLEYDPPALLVQELKRDVLQMHVEAVDQLTNKEQKLLDGEKANVRKMLNAVEAAKEAARQKSGSSPLRTAPT